jgi:hypothetical protein
MILRIPPAARLVVLCATAWLGSCSAIVHPDVGSLGPMPVACHVGDLAPGCPCPSGGTGVQVCNIGGSFDPCACVSAPGAAGNGGH